jgi:hypothetical protein
MTPAAIKSLYKISAAKSNEFGNSSELPTSQVTPVTSGNDLEWPQIGIGAVIALVLVLGIGLAVRTSRMRPAH